MFPYLVRCTCTFSFCIVIAGKSVGQVIEPVQLPEYDSVYLETKNDSVAYRTYFLNDKRVAHVGYKVNNTLRTAFTVGSAHHDSSWTIFSGIDYIDQRFNDGDITQKVFDASANNMEYTYFTAEGQVLQHGNYYVVENYYKSKFDAGKSLYKIGLWKEWDEDAQRYSTIDYDNYQVDGEPIAYNPGVDELVTYSRQLLVNIYGEEFVQTYLRLNLDKTAVRAIDHDQPNYPQGTRLLMAQMADARCIDATYDIHLNDKRFNVIELRINSEGTPVGNATYRGYHERLMTRAFDMKNSGEFHENLINWMDIVERENIATNNDRFTTYFVFENCEDVDCELFFYIKGLSTTRPPNEQLIVKKVRVNPWTGEIKVSRYKGPPHGSLQDAGN